LSEDPAGFNAGPGFYRYVHNNPVIFIDPTGLRGHSWGTLPPDPSKNTIVCDGNNGVRLQLPNLGTPEQRKCLEDCQRVHEESHRRDALADNPRVCKGKADGTIVAATPVARDASEVVASNAEIDCLRRKLETHGDGSDCDCKQIINDRIKQMEEYRDKFKH
jgi:hypothetical protein